MKTQTNQLKGFTLIELIMVIVILGILAAVAVPQFYNIQNNAFNSSEQAVLGAVQAGIMTTQANTLATGGAAPGYPATLDAIAVFPTVCSNAAPCFVNVIGQGGVRDGAWRKTAATTWSHTGANVSTYTYVAATGLYTCTATCP